MTRVGLISDTHSYMDDRILAHLKDVDEIWHAGDIGDITVMDQLESLQKRIRAVHGNIDYGHVKKMYPAYIREIIDGVDLWMTHIAGYPGRYHRSIRELLLSNGSPQLLVCGHSHILKVMYDKKYKMLSVNPGSCGIQGFHQVRTMLKFTLDKGDIKDMSAIELGYRGTPIKKAN